MKNQTLYIRIERIKPNLRLCFSDREIEDLCNLILSQRKYIPITVFFCREYFKIIDGEKRWRACKKLGITFLEAVVVEVHYTL
jgi:ParB family transcriptional regulator, chromosome partitioning protein